MTESYVFISISQIHCTSIGKGFKLLLVTLVREKGVCSADRPQGIPKIHLRILCIKNEN